MGTENDKPLTVGKLRELLAEYPNDALIGVNNNCCSETTDVVTYLCMVSLKYHKETLYDDDHDKGILVDVVVID